MGAVVLPYYIPSHSKQELERRVDVIEKDQRDKISRQKFDVAQESLNIKAVVGTLPEGLTTEDFIGILELALYTECATDTYSFEFADRARRYNAQGWLGRFNAKVWDPDEQTHHTPYKPMLMEMGFAESELDHKIRVVRSTPFEHRGGDDPCSVTTFGWLQEYLTDNWHGTIADLLERAAPEAADIARKIKRRETLHTIWYRDMTAVQVEGNPELLHNVAVGLAKFEMPGNQLVPDLQSRVDHWLSILLPNRKAIYKAIIRLLHEITMDVNKTGKIVLDYAEQKDIKISGLHSKYIHWAVNKLGPHGQGLIGEALLQKMELARFYRREKVSDNKWYEYYRGWVEFVRTALRSFIAKRITVDFGVE